MIKYICPLCRGELNITCVMSFPLVHAYRCVNCSYEYDENFSITQKLVPIIKVD